MSESRSHLFPKLRLDALTDGVFAVAMTLLVIDLRLPESFEPKDSSELLHRLIEIAHQAGIYALSFYVLALRWVGMVKIAPPGEEVGHSYTKWALIHLLLITFVPFTTSIIGRYPTFAPAVWLYAGNTILFALVAIRMTALTDYANEAKYLEDRVGLLLLIAVSVLAIVLSFIVPKWAMFAYILNAFHTPVHHTLMRARKAT